MQFRSRVRLGRPTLSVAVAALLLANLIVAAPASAARPECFGRTATIVGTSGDDELVGTRRSDVIVGRGGIDVIRARGERDFVCAGRGEIDFVFAGPGNDRVRGGRGFDGIFPSTGDDDVFGGGGFDLVTYEGTAAGVNANLATGIATGQGRDRLFGIEGLAGSEGDDVLTGTAGDDEMRGYGGNDTITAGDGNDFLNSGAGNDTVDGGNGLDFVDMAFSNAGPSLGDDTLTDAGATINLVTGSVSGGAGVGNDTLASIEGVGATLGNDTIIGNDSFNDLLGFEGDDTIDLGGPGDPDDLGTQDVAFPGGGNDTVTGSTGVDAVDYSFLSLESEPTSGATIDLQAGTASGTDIGSDTLTGIETAVGTFFADTIVGSAPANLLVGLDGSDAISGAAGDDILDGDAFVFGFPEALEGSDVLDGGPGTDVCVGGGAGDSGCESAQLQYGPTLRLSRLSVTIAGTYYRHLARM